MLEYVLLTKNSTKNLCSQSLHNPVIGLTGDQNGAARNWRWIQGNTEPAATFFDWNAGYPIATNNAICVRIDVVSVGSPVVGEWRNHACDPAVTSEIAYLCERSIFGFFLKILPSHVCFFSCSDGNVGSVIPATPPTFAGETRLSPIQLPSVPCMCFQKHSRNFFNFFFCIFSVFLKTCFFK